MANKKNSSNKKSSSSTKNSNVVNTDNGDGIEVGIGISNYVFIFISLVAIALIIYFIVRRKDEKVKAIIGDNTETEQQPIQTPVQPPIQTTPVQPPIQTTPIQTPVQQIYDTTEPSSNDPTDPENSHKWLFTVAFAIFIPGIVLGILYMVSYIPKIQGAISDLTGGDSSTRIMSGIFTLHEAFKTDRFLAISLLLLAVSVVFSSISVGHSVHKNLSIIMLVIALVFILSVFIYRLKGIDTAQQLIGSIADKLKNTNFSELGSSAMGKFFTNWRKGKQTSAQTPPSVMGKTASSCTIRKTT